MLEGSTTNNTRGIPMRIKASHVDNVRDCVGRTHTTWKVVCCVRNNFRVCAAHTGRWRAGKRESMTPKFNQNCENSGTGCPQLCPHPETKEVVTTLHAQGNCAKFEASHTQSSKPRLQTTLRGVQTIFQRRTQRRRGVGDRRSQETDVKFPKYMLILMDGAQNCLSGEAQTQETANKLLIEPPKLQVPIWREEPMAAVPVPSACWVLRSRAQRALPVCKGQNELIWRLPGAGLQVRDRRGRRLHESQPQHQLVVCCVGLHSGVTPSYHGPSDLRRRVPELC